MTKRSADCISIDECISYEREDEKLDREKLDRLVQLLSSTHNQNRIDKNRKNLFLVHNQWKNLMKIKETTQVMINCWLEEFESQKNSSNQPLEYAICNDAGEYAISKGINLIKNANNISEVLDIIPALLQHELVCTNVDEVIKLLTLLEFHDISLVKAVFNGKHYVFTEDIFEYWARIAEALFLWSQRNNSKVSFFHFWGGKVDAYLYGCYPSFYAEVIEIILEGSVEINIHTKFLCLLILSIQMI